MEMLEIMKGRHSVRQYKNQMIEEVKREELDAYIKQVNDESKLSILDLGIVKYHFEAVTGGHEVK